ncbi:uncharacterized protein LOC129608101 [Condylostylus longicornis]|uniref:uncharacterized protein LOC129608101 n=1 Tax=Condylostylus longicornis TaxID=2530218 RepID=UPI00244E26DA|nr:uncharacterized protein LOC129608101 [Condylostylus longicornis]
MEVIQVNFHISRAATGNLVGYMSANGIHIALIQEPWLVGKGRIWGVRLKDYVLYYKIEVSRQISCIFARKELKLFLFDNFCDGDTTLVRWEKKKKDLPLLLTSCYMPYDSEEEPPPGKFREAIRMWRHDVLAGCDANAHHTLWGSSDVNQRGESLVDFLSGTNLCVCNRGCDRTFVVRNRSKVIYLTLATNLGTLMVSNWMVSEESSPSNHCWIRFRINMQPEVRTPFRNHRRANWDGCSAALESDMTGPVHELHNKKGQRYGGLGGAIACH